MCISGAFSNSYRPNPSPHPTNNDGRVYPEFFCEFQLCTGWRKGELQEKLERVHCFMREIKLCNEKLSLTTAPVSGRESSRERAYSRKRVAWDQWAKNGVRLSVRHRFFLPGLPLGSLCSPIFFFRQRRFFSPFSHNAKHGPRLVSEQLLLWPLFLISEVVAYENFDCAINTYPMCDLLLEFGAAQLRFVREIAPKSPFLCVKRSLFLSARKTGNLNVQLVL